MKLVNLFGVQGNFAVRKQLFFSFLGIAVLLGLRKLFVDHVAACSSSVANNDDKKYSDIQGEPEHIDGPDCWCHPYLFFDGGDDFGDVWVHKGPGDELPPPWVLIQVVKDAMEEDGEE